jgi:hypothetical protein
MRKVKIEYLLVCLTVLSFLLASCGGSNSAFAGRWYLVEGSGEYIPEDIELLKDGTGFALSLPITWKAEKDRFYVTNPALALVFNYKLSGSKLELTNDGGKTFVYVSKFGGTSALVGAWTEVSVNGVPETGEDWQEYNRDGTGIKGTGISSNNGKFKWFADNDILYAIWEGWADKYQYQVKGETLTLTPIEDGSKGGIYEYKKRNK